MVRFKVRKGRVRVRVRARGKGQGLGSGVRVKGLGLGLGLSACQQSRLDSTRQSPVLAPVGLGLGGFMVAVTLTTLTLKP